MDFTFSHEAERQALLAQVKALSSKEVQEKVELQTSLVAQGWVVFEEETTCDYGDIYPGYWWVVHPSVVDLDWTCKYYDPDEEGVDTSLYYNLF